MNWHKRLTQAREAANIKKSAFAKAVGVSAPTVTDWENGETKMIEGANLVKVCSVLGITAAWLIDGDENVSSSNLQIPGARRVIVAEEGDVNFFDIPKVKVVVRAGVTGFQTVPEIFDGSTLTVPRQWIDRKRLVASSLIAMTVTGDSMDPRLCDGDLVVVNTDDRKMQDGEVFVFNYDGEVVIKRLVKERGSWWLFSDNPDQAKFRPRGCTDGDCNIIGKVVRRETDHI